VTSSTPTPSTGPRTSEDQPSGARHRDEGTAATPPEGPGAAVSASDAGAEATTSDLPTTGATAGSTTHDEDAPDPDIARVAADAERALADAAKEAEQAVAEAHDDGQDAVRKNYDDARRAAAQAYEQSSARADPQE
jgi:ketosteroid isomerase-like protein